MTDAFERDGDAVGVDVDRFARRFDDDRLFVLRLLKDLAPAEQRTGDHGAGEPADLARPPHHVGAFDGIHDCERRCRGPAPQHDCRCMVPPMRVTVDFDVCASTGACAQVAPEVFEVRSDGFLYILQEEPGEDLREKVQQAADLCPTAAITVED
jgi:ferredoxin